MIGRSTVFGLTALAGIVLCGAALAATAEINGQAGAVAPDAQLIIDARLASAQDNYAVAETDYRKARDIEAAKFGPSAPAVGETLAEIALQVSNQGRFQEATDLFAGAEKIIAQSANGAPLAKLHAYEALHQANQGHLDKALALATQASEERRQLLNGDQGSQSGNPLAVTGDRSELVHSLRLEAELALRLNQRSRARSRAVEAIQIVSEDPGLPLWWRADIIALVAQINEADGYEELAEQEYLDAVRLDTHFFGETTPTALGELALAEFYVRQQLFQAALPHFQAAFKEAGTDKITQSLIRPEDVVQYLTATTNASGNPVADAEVFRTAQISKTRVFDRAINRFALKRALSADLASLVEQADAAASDQHLAQAELAAEYAKPDDDRNPTREQALTARLEQLTATAGDINGKLKTAYPDYQKLVEPQPADLQEVQSKLRPGQVLIAYFVGADSGFVLVAGPHSFSVIPLAIKHKNIVDSIEALRKSISQPGPKMRSFDLSAAHELYSELVQPLEPTLSGVEELVIVPGPDLVDLPFSLLVSQAPQNGGEADFRSASWLIRRFALIDIPSPHSLLVLTDHGSAQAQPGRALLGIGNPDFGNIRVSAKSDPLRVLDDQCRQDGQDLSSLVAALPRLPETEKELSTVATDLGSGSSTLLFGRQATKGNLLALPLEQYRVVYFATHGILPGEIRCSTEPSLVLSPSRGTNGASDDGILSASEISRLQLNADLVVLSACSTAITADQQNAPEYGDGSLEALSEAFFSAGARTVLASHWKISSAATVSLMTETFAHLKKGDDAAQALRQGELAMIDHSNFWHPYYWAPFTVTGESIVLSQ